MRQLVWLADITLRQLVKKIEFLLGSKEAINSELLKLNELILKIDSELGELGHKVTNLIAND
jgi:hypothetical protein